MKIRIYLRERCNPYKMNLEKVMATPKEKETDDEEDEMMVNFISKREKLGFYTSDIFYVEIAHDQAITKEVMETLIKVSDLGVPIRTRRDWLQRILS